MQAAHTTKSAKAYALAEPAPQREICKDTGSRFRLQSAMEYLMTYGWAILIIAVVLGALFQLGVFNAGTFAPRAPPGACQVFRPNGPGSISFINLEGVCSGELPQYVEVESSSGYIKINSAVNLGSNGFTFAVWVNAPSFSSFSMPMAEGTQGCAADNGVHLVISPTGLLYLEICNGVTAANSGTGTALAAKTWDFLVGTTSYSGSTWTLTVYVNGAYSSQGSGTSFTFNNNQVMGINAESNGGFPLTAGSAIANVQVYNSSLSANEIQALYLEGIGGAPLVLQNLVGWWPLNGNANDYSGNNNNGVPVNGVSYTSQWTSGYTTP